MTKTPAFMILCELGTITIKLGKHHYVNSTNTYFQQVQVNMDVDVSAGQEVTGVTLL